VIISLQGEVIPLGLWVVSRVAEDVPSPDKGKK